MTILFLIEDVKEVLRNIHPLRVPDPQNLQNESHRQQIPPGKYQTGL